MDKKTTDYYNSNVSELQSKYNSVYPEYIKLFKRYFVSGESVLDIGCGSGRDLNILLNLGYNCYGIDNSLKMVTYAINNYPALKYRINQGSVPLSLNLSKKQKWDNILIAAVLQHIPDSELYNVISTIYNQLKKSGIILISIPTIYPVNNNRDNFERLFFVRSKDEYLALLEKIGFTLLYAHEDSDSLNRIDIIWTTLVLKKI